MHSIHRRAFLRLGVSATGSATGTGAAALASAVVAAAALMARLSSARDDRSEST